MAPLELGDARPNGACLHGNVHLWVIRQLGAGRALQLILVLFSSSPGVLLRQPSLGITIGKSVRSLRDAWLPLGRIRRGAAKRSPGARPEARRGGVAFRFPGLQVPRSPARALPSVPSQLCPRLRSCRQLLSDGERLVLLFSLPGGRGLGVRRGLHQDLFAIPEAGEGRGTAPIGGGAEVEAEKALGISFQGCRLGPVCHLGPWVRLAEP